MATEPTIDLDKELYEVLRESFNLEEMRELCHYLDINPEMIPGSTVTQMARELVQYVQRRDQLEELRDLVVRLRPFAAARLGVSGVGVEMGETFGDTYSSTIAGSPYAQINVVPPPVPEPTEAPPDEEPEPLPDPFRRLTNYASVHLTTHNGVRLTAVVTEQPWNLPVDVLVLPFGAGTTPRPGGMGRALLEALQQGGHPGDLLESLGRTMSKAGPLEPGNPIAIQRQDQRAKAVREEPYHLPNGGPLVWAATAFSPDGRTATVGNVQTAVTAVIERALGQNLHRIAIPTLGAGQGNLPEKEVAQTIVQAIMAALPATGPADALPLTEVLITTLDSAVAVAMQQLFLRLPRAALNDAAAGKDLLNVETAVYALAEMCLLKELEPPLAVGVLGGWGSGKSFVMHLMQERVAQLRSLAVTDNYPYIGHVYQITFDAWTYAKSNLWASLMQTVFYELNTQLTREQAIAQALAGKFEGVDTAVSDTAVTETTVRWTPTELALRNASPVWQVAAHPDLREHDSHALALFAAELDTRLVGKSADEQNEVVREWLQGHTTGNQLWEVLHSLKQKERESLQQTEQNLAVSRQMLEQARIDLQKQVDQKLEGESRRLAWMALSPLFAQQFGGAIKQVEARFTAVPASTDAALPETAVVPPVEADAAAAAAAAKEAAAPWKKGVALWQMIKNNAFEFLVFLLLALFLLVVTLSVDVLMERPLPGWLATAGAVMVGLARSYNKWVGLLHGSYEAYQNQLQEARTRLEGTRSERIEQELAGQKKQYLAALQQKGQEAKPGYVSGEEAKLTIPELEDRVRVEEAEADRLRQRVGMTAGFVSLLDFVSSRLDDALYEKELGLMHQVQRDLQELSDTLTAEKTIRELFPRGRPRIMLYIDDLDRCPPGRVVEVLEAVQLLLKTDLFIVVLAIDVRFITRALESTYAGILTRKGSPSGLDYIEKIIQIPYMVQPIGEDAVEGYLRVQLPVAEERRDVGGDAGRRDGATAVTTQSGAPNSSQTDEALLTELSVSGAGGPLVEAEAEVKTEEEAAPQVVAEADLPQAAVEFSEDEFACLKACCMQVPMMPRAVKRITNVYKLIKIIWYRQGYAPSNQSQIQLVMLLLVLSEQYPDQMRDLFSAMVLEMRKKSERPLLGLLKGQNPALAQSTAAQNTYEMRQWQQLLMDAEALLPEDAKVSDLEARTFNLVRAFCFVGDIGYEADESVLAAVEEGAVNGER